MSSSEKPSLASEIALLLKVEARCKEDAGFKEALLAMSQAYGDTFQMIADMMLEPDNFTPVDEAALILTGDTLVEFVLREMLDTWGSGEDSLSEVAVAMETAALELTRVENALWDLAATKK